MLTLLAVVFSNTCVDVNECLYDNGGCEHTCINTWSSRECRYLYRMPGVLVPRRNHPGSIGTIHEFREAWCQVRTI
jgi:acetamidase/formamidase